MEKIKNYSGLIFAAGFTYMILSSFITQDIYAGTTRYASLIFFLMLAVMLLPYLKGALGRRDAALFCVFLTAAVSAVNLFIVHSDKGAVLIPSDLAMLIYLSSRITLSDKLKKYTACTGGILMGFWFGEVKWSYNFNMAGLAFLMLLIFGMIFLEYMKWDLGLEYLKAVQVLLYVTSLLYTALYHSRCAMAGIILFGIFLLFGRHIASDRKSYRILVWLSTLGSVIFTLIYVIAGKTGFNMRILYKDVLSGRQDIWDELWQALLNSPFTGIGSSYRLKSFDIFEVHNGLFDILVVHGVLVYALIMIMLVKRLESIRENVYRTGGTVLMAMAGIFAMLFTSFFENFFTVPPYSVFFLYLLILCSPDRKKAV